jgi:alkylation response protein AidB-like acyl-CoA dehydrogenase
MAVETSSEEAMLLEMVRELAREQVAPRAAEIDAKGEFPWDLKELLAKQDILGMPFPEEYGGLGSSELTILKTIEELAKADATTSLILCVQQLGALPILLAGTDEQKRKWIPRLASGEWLAAYALTEPGSGSDAGAMRTRAEKRGDTYVLNGIKHFITNAGIAHVNTVFAVTEPGKGTKGTSCFVVEDGTPGFHVGKLENKMGIRGSQTGELVFEDCVIPAENLLGKEGDGFKIGLMTLDRTRPGIAAQALGIAQGALDFAAHYAKQRVQFGKPIGSFQAVKHQLADVHVALELSRPLLFGAALALGTPSASRDVSAAKVACSDAAYLAARTALQVHGAIGYTAEYDLALWLTKVRALTSAWGTQRFHRDRVLAELRKGSSCPR